MDRNDGGIAKWGGFANGDLDGEPFVGSVAGLRHYFAGFFAILADIGTIARQCLQYFGRHSPDPLRRRLHCTADIAMSLGENLDEALTAERPWHCPADLRIIERRRPPGH